MVNQIEPFVAWIVPLLFILSGLGFGRIFENIVIANLKQVIHKTQSNYDDIIINALAGMPFLWSFLAGVYGAVLYIQMSDHVFVLSQKALLVVFLFSLTLAVARMTVGVVNAYAHKADGMFPSSTIFSNITELVIFVVGILIIFQSVGISVTPILTALGVGGLAVALAMQDTLSNLFSGLHILVSKQIKPGDYIRLDSGQEGYVTDITWRNTTIRALTNHVIVVPNSKLASAIITNFFLPEKELSLLILIGVSYDSDLEQVERVTVEVAKQVMNEVPGGVPGFEPSVRYNDFADSSIQFTVMVRVKEFASQYIVKHEFIKRLHTRYKQEGIEIPFPIRTIHLKRGRNLK